MFKIVSNVQLPKLTSKHSSVIRSLRGKVHEKCVLLYHSSWVVWISLVFKDNLLHPCHSVNLSESASMWSWMSPSVKVDYIFNLSLYISLLIHCCTKENIVICSLNAIDIQLFMFCKKNTRGHQAYA